MSNTIKIQFEIPNEVYERLGKFIEDKIEAVINKHADSLKKQSTNLTRKEAAKRLRISLPTLDKHLSECTIKGQKLGKRILIPETEIEIFLNRSYNRRSPQ